MSDGDIVRKVRITGTGGQVSVEVLFGFALVGVYRMFLWDADRQFQQIAFGDNVDHQPDLHVIPQTPRDLGNFQLSYETQTESPKAGAGQSYSVSLLVRQDGRIVPGGHIERSGRLPETNNKSTIGFVQFEVV
jgi:hypothetical protein